MPRVFGGPTRSCHDASWRATDCPGYAVNARATLPRSEQTGTSHASAAEVLGTAPEVVDVPYWMDMALLNEADIPPAAFGPSGHGEYADVEWVDCASPEPCVNAYLNAAVRLCGPVPRP